MPEITGLRNNALPYPVYGVPYGLTFPILDADGDLVTGATGLDSEVSKNGDTFADCTNEATEIATTSGTYYLLLTASEMTSDVVTVIVKTSSSGAKTTVLTLYPRKLVSLRSGTAQGGAAGYITLDASAGSRDDRWNGCLCVATIDTLVEARIITDYTGSNQQAAVTPNWNVTPDTDDTFIIYLPEGMQAPSVNVTHITEQSQTARDIGASVLISNGTGTGQLDLTSGVVKANVTQYGGSNGTFSGGRPEVNTSHWGGTAVASANVRANVVQWSGNAVTWESTAGRPAVAVTHWNELAIGSPVTIGGSNYPVVAVIKAYDSVALDYDYLLPASGGGGLTAGDVWSHATRELTSGANIALAKGVGVTGLNDIAAADVWSVGTREITGGTITNYTGNTPQTADVATLITTVGAAGAGLTALASASALSTVEGKVDTVDANVDTLLTRITANLFSGITYLSKWLGAIAGKTADTDTRAEINATTAGAGYNETTDSLEAQKDAGGGISEATLAKYVGLMTRSDAAIGTDLSSELALINSNYGSGAGAFANTANKTGYALSASGANLILVDGVALPTALARQAAILCGEVSGAGTPTEIFTGWGGTVVTITVDADGNRSAVAF